MKDLTINNVVIRRRGEGGLCLTDLWRAAGSPEHKEPSHWARREGKDFIEFIRENAPKGASGPIYLSEKGRHGATCACEQLFMAYAKYLSHEFHAHVNDVWLAWKRGSLEPASGQLKELTPEAREIIGGIVKAVVAKQVHDALAEQLAPVLARLDALGAPGPDLTLVAGYVGRRRIAEMVGIASKEAGPNRGRLPIASLWRYAEKVFALLPEIARVGLGSGYGRGYRVKS